MGKSWDSASDFLPGTFHKLTIWAETLGQLRVPMCIHLMQSWNVRVSTQTIREYAAVGLHSLEKEMAMHPVFFPGKSHGHWSLPAYSP